jgi:hypothetical protein
MGLFTGLSRSEYQDVLRVVGRLLDTEGLCGLRLVERDAGLTFQARRLADPACDFATWHLADDDILALERDAEARVGTGGLRLRGAGHAGQRYQVILRAIGRLLDDGGLRDVRLLERTDGFTVQARQPGERRTFETYHLSDADLAKLVQNALARLRTGELGPPPVPGRAGRLRPLPTV